MVSDEPGLGTTEESCTTTSCEPKAGRPEAARTTPDVGGTTRLSRELRLRSSQRRRSCCFSCVQAPEADGWRSGRRGLSEILSFGPGSCLWRRLSSGSARARTGGLRPRAHDQVFRVLGLPSGPPADRNVGTSPSTKPGTVPWTFQV
ncbi:uncharacterized protein LOC134366101 isoform X2 [Cynocephalus volans]|uniref:uncharacterized protein LOC134366101 isoform X2 n=1 Tax=Cynocephalus volans TaxID=110931 RepID=UPI002FC932AC